MLQRRYLGDLPVDCFFSRPVLVRRITDWLVCPGQSRMVVTLNARMVMLALALPALQAVIRQADLVAVDGYGVEVALRKNGHPAPVRVAGIDLVKDLLVFCATRGMTVFCYGGGLKTVDCLPEVIRRRWPGLKLGRICDGYEARLSRSQVEQELSECQPQLLLVGLGSPQQELFLAQMLPRLAGTVGIGVGGALEVLAGRRREAPFWYREHGWEWLFRMVQQPRKIAGMVDLIRFWRRFLL
jgi:N-acetylglucosaminyldiphosphoundecaprenol N-acetyl-beta-D-mannosaminyltransferase